MGTKELLTWISYRAKNGPMNDVRRFDRPAALIATVLNNTFGGKLKMESVMPYGQTEKEASLEDIVAQFGGVNIGK